MEAFLITLVLVAVLAFGVGSKQVTPPTRPAGETGSEEPRAVTDKPSVPVCAPGGRSLIQRDLTKAIREQGDAEAR